MRGFDPKFKGFPQYILGVTQEIWDERGLGAKIDTYYDADVILRSPGGVVTGAAAKTAAALAVLVDFPDRTMLGEDVIWSGDTDAGMLASHRVLSTATYSGAGGFGATGGLPVTFRTVSESFAIENKIQEEWLIRDTGAILRQLGLEPRAWVQAQLGADGAPPPTNAVEPKARYAGRGNDNEWGARLAHLLQRILGSDLSAVSGEYDPACHLEYTGGLTGHGHASAARFWLGLRAAFPSAKLTVQHQIGREDPMMPPRAAVRWVLEGRHDGPGAFGAATGAEVRIMGITHAEFGRRGLRREYTLFDETSVWRQILRAG
ncbi:hypothetical protein AIOL_001244 [Candidatus Rhodobacter oscarellae]|uniref:SnoaL-like domain-containing protein n=1 Tax=Candidatus Rhodobacter oscarellae TaxID=1675527 RepID=A0A0J9E0U7_9RHOB|nr:ester cyclase [Candidatus Rhodobacter lobularis]KMW56292.1 hypothetical protein AIOL_001244 [Candidatus Rhodobacter lobularis]